MLYADSRDIAAKFNKAHRTVIQHINNLQKQLKNINEEFVEIIKKIDEYRGRDIIYYLICPRAYRLLIMSFIGDEALRYKLTYIRTFEDLEYILFKEEKLC